MDSDSDLAMTLHDRNICLHLERWIEHCPESVADVFVGYGK